MDTDKKESWYNHLKLMSANQPTNQTKYSVPSNSAPFPNVYVTI